MRKKPFADSSKINEFALKWLEIFENHYDFYKIFDELCFSDDAREVGFDMDAGKSFLAAYPDSDAFNETEALKGIIGKINDPEMLGAMIFSEWRYWNHWAMGGKPDPEWFIVALSRLAEITKD